MNKIISISLAAAIALLAVPSFASGQAYVGVSLGQSNYTLASGDDVYFNQGKTPISRIIFGGFEFNPYLAIEGGRGRFGDQKRYVRGGYQSTNSYYDYTLDANTIYGAAKGMIPLGSQFSLYAKLGITFNTSNYNSFKRNALLATGLDWQLSQHITMGLEYANYGKISKYSDLEVSTFGLTGRYNF